ncbi:hypothetical protein EJ04DRAFT_570066 [Polyplosphaeria fusca]|uniref:Uncharacterized protein n=1 Tax=Polyplosphaeria fusca TaxID=682080 RepID=A0A9P4QI90_9PLEO|nr:hypothetical protein EJ04DRAFT_570066 [Polyplosphaeria fusca]
MEFLIFITLLSWVGLLDAHVLPPNSISPRPVTQMESHVATITAVSPAVFIDRSQQTPRGSLMRFRPHSGYQDQGDMPNDDEWNSLHCKGERLYAAMGASDEDAPKALNWDGKSTARSDFMNFPAEFTKWGFDVRDNGNEAVGASSQGLVKALEGLGLSTKTADWKSYSVDHGMCGDECPDGKQINGRTYYCTQAEYQIAINSVKNTLIIFDENSPFHAVKTECRNYNTPDSDIEFDISPTSKDLPALKRTSDIIWGVWKQFAGGNKLDQIIVHNIVNGATQNALRRANKQVGVTLEYWDKGHNFPTGTEEFNALLGTPIGNGIAWLLIQHKEALGRSVVKGIKTFGLDGSLVISKDLAWVISIGDAPS